MDLRGCSKCTKYKEEWCTFWDEPAPIGQAWESIPLGDIDSKPEEAPNKNPYVGSDGLCKGYIDISE